MLISVSGLDGAGKSTLIELLKVSLEKNNHPVSVLTMYDNLSFYGLVRSVRDRIKRSAGIDEKPQEKTSGGSVVLSNPLFRKEGSKVNVRDPKIGVSDKEDAISRVLYGIVRSVVAKRVAIFLDLFTLSIVRLYVEFIKKNMLITDRYLYDSLADIADLENRKWGFIRLFLLITPTPQLPVFVDVAPEEAYARKCEYPVDYMKWRRDTYLKIFGWVDHAVIIVNDDLNTAQRALETAAMERLDR